jgi:hypothetical protein
MFKRGMATVLSAMLLATALFFQSAFAQAPASGAAGSAARMRQMKWNPKKDTVQASVACSAA